MAAALFAARAGARLAPAAGAALPAARWEPSNARGMASLSDVKQRMKSVANIVKITKAMKMVAAARLRSAQTNVIESRGMREGMHRMMGDLPSGEGVETLVSVPMTSDRGLCGGINSNINKYTKQIGGLNEAEKTSYVVVGEKGRARVLVLLAGGRGDPRAGRRRGARRVQPLQVCDHLRAHPRDCAGRQGSRGGAVRDRHRGLRD